MIAKFIISLKEFFGKKWENRKNCASISKLKVKNLSFKSHQFRLSRSKVGGERPFLTK